MKKLKNGLYIDFEWDEDMELPMLIITDTADGERAKMWFNLNVYTLDEAVEAAEKEILALEENENY